MITNTFNEYVIGEIGSPLYEKDTLSRTEISRARSIAQSPLYNSDKCCGGTRDSTHGNFCYVLKELETAYGSSIGIETYYNNGDSGVMSKGANILLSLPFRFPIADRHMIRVIPIREQPVVGNSLEWNPGLESNGSHITTLLDIPDKYYELNLSAAEMNHLIHAPFKLYNNWGGRHPTEWFHARDIASYVLEPKMMVEHAGNGDYITISYNARVDLKGELYHWEGAPRISDDYHAHLYWTVPYVIRFFVDKSDLSSKRAIVTNRYAWTYGVDTTKQYGSNQSLNGLSGDISTKSYDYGIIPVAKDMSSASRGPNVFVPISWGCKSDIAVDTDRDQTIIYSSLGFYDSSLLTFYTRPILSRVKLDTIGFNSITESVFTENSIIHGRNRPCNKVSISINDTTLLSSFSYSTNTDSPISVGESIIKLYDISSSLLSDGFSTTIKNAISTISAPYSDGFVLSYTDGITSAKCIFFPTTVSRSNKLNNNQYIGNSYKLLDLSARLASSVSRYNPFVAGRFLLDQYLYREIFAFPQDIDGTHDVIPRPIGVGAIVLDIPKSIHSVRSRFYTVPTSEIISHFVDLDTDIYTVYDSNEDNEQDYFYITQKESDEEHLLIDAVTDYKTHPITITGSIIQPEYWVNPEFAQSEVDGENRGVRMIISLLDCSGLYTEGTISGGDAWDPTARPAATYPGGVIHGGIPLDPSRKRNDLDYLYHGTEEGYQLQQPPDGTINSEGDVRFGGSYSVHLENSCDIQLTYKGYNILAGSDIEGNLTIDLPCWKYNESGLFNAYIDIHLQLDDITGDNGKRFTDDGFSMSGCLLSVDLKNKYGYSISRFEEREVDIIPPSASGYINAVSYKKSTGSPKFELNRVINPASLYFTTVRNVKYNYYDYSEDELKAYYNSPSDFYEDSNNGGTTPIELTFDSDIELDKGDYVQVSYESRLHDSRSDAETIKFSDKVSYVSGHKFHIDNVKIEFSGDTGWSDVTDDIEDGSVLYYNSINDLHLRVTYDAEHEFWPNRSELNDYQIYPYISGLYLFAVKSINRWDPTNYEEVNPLTSTVLTYPNHTDSFASTLISSYNLIKNRDADVTSVVYPGDTTLTSFSANTYSNEITIDDPGQYQLYAMLEDEFEQFSCFCITNIRDNYHIPFRSS